MTRRLLPALREVVLRLLPDAGKPRVDDDQDVRCLRFDGGALQSAMRLADPFALDLSYTRLMMGFLLFNAEPRHILLVGLGGGSLSKYCHRHLPQARITTLEINPDVIALRDRFLIPPDDERFRIVQADAGDYLARRDVQADVILLDGYDAAGLPPGLCAESFYANCWQALSPAGVLVANLWGGELNRGAYLQRLLAVFDGQVWWGKTRDGDNLVVFAVKDRRYRPQWSRLMARAQTFGRQHRLELPQLVSDLRDCPDPDS